MGHLFARLLVVLALTGAGTAGGVVPASAAGPQPCVGVVVDARPLGGSVGVRCSQGAAGRDAVQVLQDAGFRVRIGASGSYSGFLCQVNGLPASSSDDSGCGEDAENYRYWGFFTRAPGEKGWTYATRGVRGHKPVDGGQIGLRFQTTPSNQAPPVYAQDEVCPPTPAAAPSRTSAAAPPRPATTARGRSTAPRSTSGPRSPIGSPAARPAPAASPAAQRAGPGPATTVGPTPSPQPMASATAAPLLPENGTPVPAGNDLGVGDDPTVQVATGQGSSTALPWSGVLGAALLLGLGIIGVLRHRSMRLG